MITNQILFDMKTLLPFIAICLLFAGCSGKKQKTVSTKTEADIQQTETKLSWYDGEKPFKFDEKENYPETNIKLSELAEASYIPIGTNDSTILRLLGTCNGNDYCITSEHIYSQENQQKLYIFKIDGTPIKIINKQGEGPEDYSFISSYAVDTLNKEIFIQDMYRKRTVVYDLDGNFKRTFPNLAKEIVELNDSLLLNFFQLNPKGPRYSVIRKDDGKTVLNLPIRFNIKLPTDTWGQLAYGSLIKTPQGAFMSNLQNDTIFEIKRNLSITPRIIDISDYGTNFAQVHPTIETARYLMFYILCCHSCKPKVQQRFYIYDKKEKQIYKMTDYSGNSYWTLMDDYPHIQNWETTQNPNIAIRTRQVDALFQAEGKHGDAKLQEIIKHLNEDDNPVLQVMTFHDVNQVLK